MKKMTALLLLLAMLLSVFMVSCDTPSNLPGGNESKETESENEKQTIPDLEGVDAVPDIDIDFAAFDPNEAVEITFYHTMGENLRTVLDAYIEKFNELYPNITIVHEQVGGYDDVRNQISTEIPAGLQPNIAYCYADHVALYNLAKAVQPLDSFIASQAVVTRADGSTEIIGLTQEQRDDFIEGYYQEGAQYGDGKMYSMPFSKSTEVLYYNKTFFDQHNLKVPTTWDEMEEVMAQIVAIDPMSIPLGYDSEANWFITMCEQYGSDYTSATGEHFLFNNETNRSFVKRFREWYQNGYVTTQEILGAFTSSLFTTTDEIRSYMSIGSSAGATHQRPQKVDGAYPFEVGIAPIPQLDASNPKVISQGPSVTIFKSDSAQEVIASWLFVKYLTTSTDFQAEFSIASGYVPVLKSVADHEVYKSEHLDKANGYDYIAALSSKVCLEQADAYYTSPAFNGSAKARDQVGYLMTACLVNDDGGNVDAFILKEFEKALQECRK